MDDSATLEQCRAERVLEEVSSAFQKKCVGNSYPPPHPAISQSLTLCNCSPTLPECTECINIYIYIFTGPGLSCP